MAPTRRWGCRLTAVLVAAVLCIGCAGGTSGKGGISLTVSGGVAGVHEGIEVSEDGTVHLTDRQGTRREAPPLSDGDRRTLEELVGAVDFAELPDRSVSEQARDRFEYRLEYDGTTLVTDRSAPLGPVDDLIDRLETWLRERS